MPTFPLFDAFIVELDRDEKFAVLWVIQVTTSPRHGGSSSGYKKVRQIVGILKTELQGEPDRKKIKASDGQAVPAPSVEVRYLLVVPKGELQTENWTWKFPSGWNEHRQKHDHCGNVYCMEVPVA